MERPILYVLAGVNGAGKSSVGGHILTQAGMAWFNPDTFARELVQRLGRSQDQANADAWAEGVRRLDAAVAAASGLNAGSASGSNTETASGSAASQDSGSAQETPVPEAWRFTVHIPHLQRYEAEAYVASIPGAWMTEEGGE